MHKNGDIPSIYISYAWNSESEVIVDAIESEFQKRGARIIRDKTNLEYKGSIKDFMDQIGQGNYVILVISNKYLRSENCMYELLQIFKYQNFYDRIFPVVLDEVRIAKSADRIELMKYWENEVAGLDKKVRELKELSNIQGVTDDINLYREIRDHIAQLTHILKDINTLNTDQHIRSDFTQLYSLIQTRIGQDQEQYRAVKAKSKRLKQGVIAVLGLGLIAIIFFNLPQKPEDSKLPNLPDSLARQELNLDLQNYSTEAAAVAPPETKDAGINDHKTGATGMQYEVTLVVPSYMVNASVFVDNDPAEIIERNLVFIKIRVTRKDSSHHIEIRDGNEKCSTDKFIAEDNVKLTLCT